MDLFWIFIKRLSRIREFGFPVQRLVTHTEQGGKGDSVPIPVRGNGGRLHIDGHTPADVYLAHGSRFYKFPVSVGSREYRAQPVLPLSLVQLLFQVDIEQVIRGNGNIERKKIIEDPIVPHKAGCKNKVPDIVMIPQPSAVPHHNHGIGTQDSHMIRYRLSIGRAHSYIHKSKSLVVR